MESFDGKQRRNKSHLLSEFCVMNRYCEVAGLREPKSFSSLFYWLKQGWPTQTSLWAATWKFFQNYRLFGPHDNENLMKYPQNVEKSLILASSLGEKILFGPQVGHPWTKARGVQPMVSDLKIDILSIFWAIFWQNLRIFLKFSKFSFEFRRLKNVCIWDTGWTPLVSNFNINKFQVFKNK